MTSPVKRQREEDELQTTVVDGEQQAVDALAPVNK